MLATTITFLLNFWAAYDNEDKKVVIDINSKGEANAELGLSILTLVFSFSSFFIIMGEVIE